MKALVYTGAEALEYRDVPDPVPCEGEVLVRVAAIGICGSDMHAYLGHDERRPAPLVLGHEAAGVVLDGKDPGKRVTINPLVNCGDCRDCTTGRTNLCARREIISMPPRDGAFAQLVSVPERNLIAVPEHVEIENAALVEPIACGWHAVRLGQGALGVPLEGRRCVVLGGGGIGVGAALSLAAFGADDIQIVEPNAARRARLNHIGSCRTTDSRGEDVPAPGSVDLIIDAVGLAATRAQACELARPGGVIVHIGLGESTGGLDVRRMTLQEIVFIGTYTYTDDDFKATAQAMFDGRLGAFDWTELRALADGAEAFTDIRSGRAAAPKLVLIPES